MSDLEKIAQLLASFPLLADQDNDFLLNLSRESKVIRYEAGQVISRLDHKYSDLLFIIKGSIRSVVASERLPNRITTLQKLGAGSICGWSGLTSGKNRENLLASTQAIAIIVSHDCFLKLSKDTPVLLGRIRESVHCAELFYVLERYYKDFPVALASALAKACPSLVGKSKMVTCNSNHLDHLNLDNKFLWVFASGGCETGSPFPSIQPARKNDEVRLLGVSRVALKEVLDSASQRNSNQETSLDHSFNDKDLSDQWESRFHDLDQKLIEEAPAYRAVKQDDGESDPLKLDQYPWYSGKSTLESSCAAMRMLGDYFNLPNRSELVKRLLSDYLKGHKQISLALIGAIAESIGLQTQLLNVSAEGLQRLPTPFFVYWDNGIGLVYKIHKQQLIVGIPAQGVRKFTINDFSEHWGASGEVLPVRKSEFTPQKSFGFSWFLPALKEHRAVLIEVLLASFFVQLFGLVNPLLIQQIIDKVVINNNSSALGVFSLLLIIFAVFEGLLLTLRTFLFVDTTNRIDLSLGTQIIDHLLRLPLSYFDQRPVGEVSSRIGELEKIRGFLTGTALTTILDAVFAMLYIAVMFAYSWQLTLVSLSVVPILVVLTLTVSPLIKSQLQKRAIASAKTQSHLVEILSGMMTVKSQNIELKSRWRWQELYTDFIAEGFDNTILSTSSNTISSFLNKLSSLLVICVGASLILNGKLSLGELIAFRIISGYVTGPLLRMTSIWQNLQETSLSLARLADVIDNPQETSESNGKMLIMPSIEGSISFQDICFRYKPSSPLLLNSVDLELPAGKFVAVVGASGSGKSTLTKLLARLYTAEKGSIFVDGVDISKVELYSYRSQLGIVPQDSVLFDGTVEENIALTSPSASSQDIADAAKVANAHEFIMALPAGYSTQVGERGSGLSGGQRQRIAIARTVLRKPNLLIMDEATSALDYQTERIVCENLMESLRGSTVLFITHRLSSIVNADLIVCMGNGSVLEVGSHQALVEKRGAYFALYMQQGQSSEVGTPGSSSLPPVSAVL